MYRVNKIAPDKVLKVPTDSEDRIEKLCEKIRGLCRQQHTPKREAELRKLARELRIAINAHVRMAKSSLNVKISAIAERDPDKG
jgi:hypothetical protein